MAKTIRRLDDFSDWLHGLKDRRARAYILVRIDRAEAGNYGDYKPVGEGVFEMRIDQGPGYRVYFVERGKEIVILLAGGTKKTQKKDILRARILAANL